ncbi:DUF445 domain-containing protein [[Clostridium] polysaccharolyticum]|uniref:Uncharacterized membrane protein YheB, UPF0754 family n=1 Tax=[Clostridium] polysaccharolyticum TaxID=29364 RepID=A0A1H9YMU1_9FIRM|nr:DUF445 family protein [[Clostridium] polysaccharolyticum]SES70301.1 Uncharacterized membrane protein YheB, UPF0754 family [[Clostridium] polysaccharolyticum]
MKNRKNGVTMKYTIFITPLIGALIGYITNYIAVKMLFRPLKPIMIGKFKVPFTPGIIPKEKPRLAKAIGEIVGRRLVTKDGLETMLLSDNVKETLRNKISGIFQNSDTTLEHFLAANLSQEKTDSLRENITTEFTKHIVITLQQANAAELLAKEIIGSIKEHFQGGFLAMMLNDSLLSSIEGQISKGLNSYLENHGEEIIKPYVTAEYDKMANLSLADVKAFTVKHDLAIEDMLLHVYEYLIRNNLDKIITLLKIDQIAQEQINQMDVLELEELILSVMKKELNAIVNLGALIGFVLGLINLLLK